MGTTPRYALPYPELVDPADVPTDMQELALAVENRVGITRLTPAAFPPASPFDGQLVELAVTDPTGVTARWLLRYDAAWATDAHKWQLVGGGPLATNIPGSEAPGSAGAWVDLATVGPRLTAPRPGAYALDFGFTAYITGGATKAVAGGIAVAAGTPMAPTVRLRAPVGNIQSAVMQLAYAATAGTTELRLRYNVETDVNAAIENRWLRLRPFRIS